MATASNKQTKKSEVQGYDKQKNEQSIGRTQGIQPDEERIRFTDQSST